MLSVLKPDWSAQAWEDCYKRLACRGMTDSVTVWELDQLSEHYYYNSTLNLTLNHVETGEEAVHQRGSGRWARGPKLDQQTPVVSWFNPDVNIHTRLHYLFCTQDWFKLYFKDLFLIRWNLVRISIMYWYSHKVKSFGWSWPLLAAGFYGRPWTMEQRTDLFKRYVPSVFLLLWISLCIFQKGLHEHRTHLKTICCIMLGVVPCLCLSHVQLYL